MITLFSLSFFNCPAETRRRIGTHRGSFQLRWGWRAWCPVGGWANTRKCRVGRWFSYGGFHKKKGIPTVFIVCRRNNPESFGPKLPIYGWFMMEKSCENAWLKYYMGIQATIWGCLKWGILKTMGFNTQKSNLYDLGVLPDLGNLRMSSVWGFY